jgi:hypothetical protein
MYGNESGALNEAMSDIFGSLVDQSLGATGDDVWLIGENVVKTGRGIRDMSNPFQVGHYDYFPSRYQGELNKGGVHWNSGIATLAFKLLITGGTHPRGLSDVNVTGLISIFDDDEDLAFAVAGKVFYCANSRCLTRRSTFLDARYCTATICGTMGLPEDEEIVQSIHQAWEAVGVSENVVVPTDAPTQSPIKKTEQEEVLDFPSTMSPTTIEATNPPKPGFPTSSPSTYPSSIPSVSTGFSPTVFPSLSSTIDNSDLSSPSTRTSEAPSFDVSKTLQPDSISPSPQPSDESSMASTTTTTTLRPLHKSTFPPSAIPILIEGLGKLGQLDGDREDIPESSGDYRWMRIGIWGGMASFVVLCLGFFVYSLLQYHCSVSEKNPSCRDLKIHV